MDALTLTERKLLEKLADAGQPTQLCAADLVLGKILERRELVFFVRDTTFAVITPKGRHMLADPEPSPKSGKKPFGFLG